MPEKVTQFQVRKWLDNSECSQCGTLRDKRGYPMTRIEVIFHYKENPTHRGTWREKIVAEVKP